MRRILAALCLTFFPLSAAAGPITPRDQRAVDASIRGWMTETGAPSVSVAIVKQNKLVYAQAYGFARRDPDVLATTRTRYAICSVTKQFTAAAILRLQEQGRLSLDDRIARFFPGLASADSVSLRQILSHTATYPELWTSDFVTARMAKPVSFAAILNEWATKPLASLPGTRWDYSNTNFILAGAIVEKVSGQSYLDFLKASIFAPLGMNDVIESDDTPLAAPDAAGYTHYGEGPTRLSPRPARGWEFAAGGLAMTPTDLARWDISLMTRSLLNPQSYAALYAPVKLADGGNTNYSLGLGVYERDGRLDLEHGGDGPGFTAESIMWPAQRTAIIVFANEGSYWASSIASLRDDLVRRIAYTVLPPTEDEARARSIFKGLREGRIDRGLFNADANAYFTPAVLADEKQGLARFAPLRFIALQSQSDDGGIARRNWKIVTAGGTLMAFEIDRDGKLEQFIVSKPG
ncbi:MAG: serine hydrolase domain-containing protein [Rhizomicrobium sp.]|jgi:CubicO group peptidase (beta-lactamase class C family)